MKNAPPGYLCPFCGSAETLPLPAPESAVVLIESTVFALVPTHYYGGIKGNCLVIPRTHHENVLDIPDDLQPVCEPPCNNGTCHAQRHPHGSRWRASLPALTGSSRLHHLPITPPHIPAQ